jgi:hypothetical protein
MLKHTTLWLACLGLVLPRVELSAAQPVPEKNASKIVFSDVELAEGSVLTGSLVDSRGQGIDGAKVSIRYKKKEIASTVTDAKGGFAVKGLRGGEHIIVAGDEAALVRLWAPNTAPPKAHSSALLVRGSSVVRGQFGGIDMVGLATLGIASVAAAYAISNHDKIKDLEDQVNKLPTSF